MPSLKPLEADESLFSNIDSLDTEFVPKFLPHRESEQKLIAEAIAPLLKGISGQNLLIFGSSGLGKTAAVKRVLEDFKEQTEEVAVVFVNCWVNRISEKILSEVCRQLNYKLTAGLTVQQLVEKIKQQVFGKKGVVLVFDEADKARDTAFLYAVLECLEKKAVVLISNNFEWSCALDERIRSRLLPETIEFKHYSKEETADILAERRKFAFFEGTWSKEAINLAVEKTFNAKDLRFGITLLRMAGLAAESEAKRVIEPKHVLNAVKKIESLSFHKPSSV